MRKDGTNNAKSLVVKPKGPVLLISNPAIVQNHNHFPKVNFKVILLYAS